MFKGILSWMLVTAAVIGVVHSHSIPVLHHKPEVIFPPHHNEFKEIIGLELKPIPIHGDIDFELEKHKHELMEHERELAHGLLEKELLEKELKRKHEMLEHEHKALEHREHEILEHEKKELEHRQHEILEHERKELEHRQHDLLEHERKELEHREHDLLEHEHRELEHREHDFLDHMIPPHEHHPLPPPEEHHLFPHDVLKHHNPHDHLERHGPHHEHELEHIPPHEHDVIEHHIPPHNSLEHHLPHHKGFEHHVPPHKGLEHHPPLHDGLEHHTPHEHGHEHGILEHEHPHNPMEHDILEHELPPPWEDPNFVIEEEIHHHEQEFHHDELFPVEGSERRSNRRGGSSSRRGSSSNRGRSNNRGSSNSRGSSSNRGSSNNRSNSNRSNNRSSSNNRNSSNNRRSSNSNRSSNNNNNSRRNRNNINTAELFPRRNRQNNRGSNSNSSNRRNNNRRNSNLEELASMEQEIFMEEPEAEVEIVSRPERQADYGYVSRDETVRSESSKARAVPETSHIHRTLTTSQDTGPVNVATFRNTFEFAREETEGFTDGILASRTPILSGHRGRSSGVAETEYSNHDESSFFRGNTQDRRRQNNSNKGTSSSSTSKNIFNQESGNSYVQDEEFLILDNDQTIQGSRPNQGSSRPSGSRPSQFGNNGFYPPGHQEGNRRPQNPQGSFFVNEPPTQRPGSQRPGSHRPGSQRPGITHRPEQSFGSSFENEESSRPSHRPSNNFGESNQRPPQRPSSSNFNNQDTSNAQRPFSSGFTNQENSNSQRPFGSSSFSSSEENFRPQRPGTSNSEEGFNSFVSGFSGHGNSRPQRPSNFNSAASSSSSSFSGGSGSRPQYQNSGFSSESSFSESNHRPQRPLSSSSFSEESSYRPQRPSSSSNFNEESSYRPQRPSSSTGFFEGTNYRPHRPSSGSDFLASETSYRPYRPSTNVGTSSGFSSESYNRPQESDYNTPQSSRPYRPSTFDNEGFSSNQHGVSKPYQAISNSEETLQNSEERPGSQYGHQLRPQEHQFNGGYSEGKSQRPVSVGNGGHLVPHREEPKRPGSGPILEQLTSLEDGSSEGVTGSQVFLGGSLSPPNGNSPHRPDVVSLQGDSWLWPDDGQVEALFDQNNHGHSNGQGHGHAYGHGHNHGNQGSNGHNHAGQNTSPNHGSNYHNSQHTGINNQNTNKLTSTTARSTTKRPSSSGTTNFKNHPNIKLLPIDTCGIDLGNKIIGGTNTQLDEFPWMALLQHTSETGQSLGFGCGGSLISPRYILTAAHCIKGPSIKNNIKVTKVRLGEFDTSSDIDCQGDVCNQRPLDASVEEIIVHPKYRATDRSQLHDIALIRLREDVKNTAYIHPICLPWNGSPRNLTNERLVTAGWGKTANGQAGKSSKTKQKVSLPGVNLEDCSPFYNKINIQLQETQMCAGGEKGKDSCQGDSGGPLMMTQAVDNQVKWQVHGVVSFGPEKCGIDNVAGVYTKVSEYLGWILDNIKK